MRKSPLAIVLAIVERDKDRSVHNEEATSRPDFRAQMDQAGFAVIRVDTSMMEDNIYITRLKPGPDGAGEGKTRE